jgi:hypothetical protein
MFWDSSALVPVLLPEPTSVDLVRILRSDARPTIWWSSPIECRSAIYRRHRHTRLSPSLLDRTLRRLDALMQGLDTVAPTDPVRDRAGRLLGSHALRAADALQLASALVWCAEKPQDETFVSLDERLRVAAGREGFQLLPA